MRILIVHNILWAHYKSSIFQSLQHLVDQQSDTEMCVLQIARNERSRADLENMDSLDSPTYCYNYKLLFDRFLDDVSLGERTRAILQHARAFRPDIITLTGYYDPAQLFLLVWAKTKGIRVIMQNESTEADHQRKGLKERFKQYIFSQCDGFFCFGTQSANYLIRLGVRPDKILLRKSAVDNDALRIAYERALPNRIHEQKQLGIPPNNFVFVGRFIAFKNLRTLIACFADAQKQVDGAESWGLILLGDGPERDQLQQQINELGIVDKVRFLPGRPWFQVPNVLALSNVLVLPSWSEPWGLVVNEAMACGLPVIVSDRCGCAADLVHQDKNGFLFDAHQPAELTRRLIQFISRSVDAQRMGQYAKQFIEPYSPEAVGQEMLDGFRKIMN